MRLLLSAVLLAALTIPLEARSQGGARPPAETAIRMAQLLEASKYTYRKTGDLVWAIGFKGKTLSDIQVVVTAQANLAVFVTILARKAEMSATPEMMQRMLKLNSEMDRVKIGLDDDGDLFVRSDVSMRLLDVEELKAQIEQVAAAADETYAALRPFLTAQAGSGGASTGRDAAVRSYARTAGATRRVDILRGQLAVFIDPAKWRETKSTDPGKTTFQHASGDGYAMVIAERLQVQLPQLKKIALDNARNAAPDARVVLDEMRRVNGLDVVAMQITGTMSGVLFVYYGYYYSGPEGSVQIITYTGQNLFAEYKADFEEFLNGFQADRR